MFVLQGIVHRHVALVAAFCNFAFLHCLKDGAALLFGVRALGIAALADVRLELTHRVHQIVAREEIEAHKVEHTKAGGVRNIRIFHPVYGVKLHAAGGMLAARDAVTDLTRLQGKSRKECIKQGGFPNAGRACEGGGLSRHFPREIFAQGFYALALFGGEQKDGEARKLVGLLQLGGVFGIDVALADDKDRLDAVELRDGDQLVDGFGDGSGLCGRDRDK